LDKGDFDQERIAPENRKNKRTKICENPQKFQKILRNERDHIRFEPLFFRSLREWLKIRGS
jgi:hypothetical protein